ncbi:aldo/keto reductase [Stieleria varia]|uniref:General stress protein 69 n=1 Tax=Stieleria varia TaxID=2528005 RepID=A0A5C6AR62_9BACT|nr:aldo/keto reductase [Stieleria varia]TWU02445.1 General stress protein 69 [Stieleria varia]
MSSPTPNRHVVLGLWPIAGITTLGVTESDALQTIRCAIDAGITRFDTAFAYGYDGRSDRMLGDAIASRRDEFDVIGKVGQRWTSDHQRVLDGRPETLIADAETSLRRIGIEQFDTLMLHAPDPKVPIQISANAIAELTRRGLSRRIGVCNVDVEHYQRFRDAVGCDAVQCPLNMLQSDASASLIRQCEQDRCDVFTFWTLMKGLLAGKISREHTFADGDSRPGYAVFQGQQRENAHKVLDELAPLACKRGRTIAQLAIGWVLSQPGVTAALVGAHKPEQIAETAAATPLDEDLLSEVDSIVYRNT